MKNGIMNKLATDTHVPSVTLNTTVWAGFGDIKVNLIKGKIFNRQLVETHPLP